MGTAKKVAAPTHDQDDETNEVRIVGRLGAPAMAKELPSGDVVVTFRVVTRRGRRHGSRASRDSREGGAQVDTIDCTAWRADVRKSVSAWEAGDVIEVEGALRRRFWRDPVRGAASRVEVEVCRARRRRRAE